MLLIERVVFFISIFTIIYSFTEIVKGKNKKNTTKNQELEKIFFDQIFEDENNSQFANDCYRWVNDKISMMSADGNDTHISEWVEILPICQIIDEWYQKTHPNSVVKSLYSKAKKESGLMGR